MPGPIENSTRQGRRSGECCSFVWPVAGRRSPRAAIRQGWEEDAPANSFCAQRPLRAMRGMSAREMPRSSSSRLESLLNSLKVRRYRCHFLKFCPMFIFSPFTLFQRSKWFALCCLFSFSWRQSNGFNSRFAGTIVHSSIAICAMHNGRRTAIVTGAGAGTGHVRFCVATVFPAGARLLRALLTSWRCPAQKYRPISGLFCLIRRGAMI